MIAWSEILKNIIFPFQFTGPIIPYMARIDLAILSSGIVGITSDMIKTAKYSLPDSVLIFDIDSREIFKNRREFIQATDSKVLLSSDINEENEQKL